MMTNTYQEQIKRQRNQISRSSKKKLRAIMIYKSDQLGFSLTLEQCIDMLYNEADLPEEYKVEEEDDGRFGT